MISFWFVITWLLFTGVATTFKDDFSMSFEDHGFSLGMKEVHAHWPWTALSTFLESPHFFHLYFDSRSFFLVPKSGFRSSDEVFELRQLLKEKIRRRMVISKVSLL